MKRKLMKLSIISLTSINLAMVPLVVATREYENFRNKDNSDDAVVMTETVTATESEFLDSSLFNNVSAAASSELLTSFENNEKIPKSPFTNDDSKKTSNETDGAPDVRFGGGLFFDIKNENMNDKTYASANFISIKKEKLEEQLFFENEEMTDDISAQKVINEDSGISIDHNHKLRSGRSKWDFSKSKNENQSNFSNISTSTDFSLTPDYVQGGESNIKNTFNTLFNAQLYNWYWETWGNNYLPYSVGRINKGNAYIRQEDLKKSELTNAPKINLSLSWNQLISSNIELPWYAQLLKSVGVTTVGTALSMVPPYGPIIGLLATTLLDMFLPNTYETFESIENSVGYFSKALDTTFWLSFFNQYLGTPKTSGGLINNFKSENNGNLPSTLTLNNFDFYIPYETMKINSDFNWGSYNQEHPKGPDTWWEKMYDNSSQSLIDLSGLQVKLGANFTLTRETDDTIFELISKLPELGIGASKNQLALPYDASTSYNKILIQSIIESRNPKMSKISGGLSFEGQLEVGKTNFLKVFYKGIDQNIILPFKIIDF